jgi:GT2 family glycosyltransferase
LNTIELVVINYRTYDLLQEYIDSYLEFTPTCSSHLTIIDVDSTEELDGLSLPDNISVVSTDWNLGYALSCNYGAFNSDSEIIAFFNADTRFNNSDCVDYCVNFLLENDDVGVVGPLQYSSDGKCTHGGIFGTLSKPIHNGWASYDLDSLRFNQKAVTVSGSAYFIKRSVWADLTNCEIYRSLYPDVIGAFLPTQHYFEETACSYHTQSHGKEIWYLGEAEMIHEWHRSSPVGSEVDQKFGESKRMFVDFCEAHGIDHD